VSTVNTILTASQVHIQVKLNRQGGPKSKPQTFDHIFAEYLTDFRNFYMGAFCGKFVTSS